jgi:hypothetical protein
MKLLVASPTTASHVRAHRSTQVPSLLSAAAIIAAAVSVIHVNSGDAAVYFTYFKQFFRLPFSYAPGQVSFGATSPLWVILNAPFALLFGNGFVTPSRLLAGGFLFAGVCCLAAAAPRSNWNLPLVAALTILNVPLIAATSQLFETGLTFALIALVYFAMCTDRPRVALIGAGLLPLARPETALMSIFVYLWTLSRSRDRRHMGSIALASLIPLLLYIGYMSLETGGIVPSSVSARVLLATEGHASWAHDFLESFGRSFWTTAENAIYPLGAVMGFVAIARIGVKALWLELALLALLVVPFVVQPPISYAPRYLEVATPLMTVIVLQVLLASSWRTVVLPVSTVGILLLAGYILHPYLGLNRFSYNRLLLRDLADKLNPLLRPGDKVLLYEIQGQYYLSRAAVSADGIVGGATLPVLRGQLSWERFIRQDHITYVVTMDAFDYRRVYDRTLLARLYAYDLDHPVGARMRSGGLVFTKVLTNPDFANPARYVVVAQAGLNVGNSLRVYGPSVAGWSDSYFPWNSVYRVGDP